ncbi:MAG: RIP metalloprotease RseP [Solobacterium sp.]|jgi:regulator of sigma E protease|nr:RIP metalloprotease RseP [Solobacterium sp.]MCH4221817.1 RIP metalloprotease RseP [Solobacterium sp.]MCH4265039.1 RIP metalloprotease RseP [Solobacterium sp.]
MLTIILFILLLTVIICIHEWGHLIAAKAFNVYCFEYSFGMGPVIFKHKTKETQYSIRAVPVGGFVSMAGESDGDEAYPDVIVPEGRRLTDQKPWKRIIIMLAGVFMNFILAWVIFSLVILNNGAFAESPKSVVSTVVADSPAERAGFESGDRITKVTSADGNSSSIDTYTDLSIFMATSKDQQLTFQVERDGSEITLTATPEYNDEEQSYFIGIAADNTNVHAVNFFNCWYYGAKEMGMITSLLFSTIISLFHGFGLDQLSGPVGIYNATETSVSYGLTSYLFLIAELSLNVGIFNLLPLPVLDGGQVVITLGEWITHRKLNEKVKIGIMGVCWVLLIGLMIFATFNDITRLFS